MFRAFYEYRSNANKKDFNSIVYFLTTFAEALIGGRALKKTKVIFRFRVQILSK